MFAKGLVKEYIHQRECNAIFSVCGKDYFNCGDGICLHKDRRCDCNRDCANNADEENCGASESFFLYTYTLKGATIRYSGWWARSF